MLKNILFTGNNLLHVKSLIEYIKSQKDYLVEIDLWKDPNEYDEHWSESCLVWADIILCVGGFKNAVWYSKRKKDDQIVIIKMDSNEIKTRYPLYFNTKSIDCFIVESISIQQEYQRVFPFLKGKMKTINSITEFEDYISLINSLTQDL